MKGFFKAFGTSVFIGVVVTGTMMLSDNASITQPKEEKYAMDPPTVIVQSDWARYSDLSVGVRWITVDGVLCLQYGDHQGSIVPFPDESGTFSPID